jgi:hypothetical protein
VNPIKKRILQVCQVLETTAMNFFLPLHGLILLELLFEWEIYVVEHFLMWYDSLGDKNSQIYFHYLKKSHEKNAL